MTSMSMSPSQVGELVEAVRRADSALALLQATQALAASAHPDGAACLVEILGFNNPGAAVAAVDGLVARARTKLELPGRRKSSRPRGWPRSLRSERRSGGRWRPCSATRSSTRAVWS